MNYDDLVEKLLVTAMRSNHNREAADAITTLQAELEQCRKDAEWKAIETAPKDMAVLLYCFSHYEIGHFNTSLSAWACCWDHRKLTQPTHWKPLPKPPVTDAAIDKAMESV